MFSIELDILDKIEQSNSATRLIEGTSIEEVLMSICDELDRHSEIITFSVNGFNKDWQNISINPDLCMLMEDLPGLVNFMNNEKLAEFQFGFPEQHIQRILIIRRVPSGLKIICNDWLYENQDLTEELFQIEYFRKLLRKLVAKIWLIIDRVCPIVYENSIFQDWVKQVQL
jgi:hypothetical protein